MANNRITDRLGLMLRGSVWSSNNVVLNKSVRPSGITLFIVRGRLEKEAVDVVVNSIDVDMNLAYGAISSAIYNKAGPALQTAINLFPGPGKHGDLLSTSGLRLRARAVYHAILCNFNKPDAGDVLESLVLKCLNLADEDKYTSIAIPALGTGGHEFPSFVVAHRMLEAIRRYEQQEGEHARVKIVRIVLQEDKCISAFQCTLNEIPCTSQKALVEKMKDVHQEGLGPHSKIRDAKPHSNPVNRGIYGVDNPTISTLSRRNTLPTKLVNALRMNVVFKKEELISQLRTFYRELPCPGNLMCWPYVVTSKKQTLCSRDMDALVNTMVGTEVHRKRSLVLLHGGAYVGKSSLVNRLARLWADGELKHIRLVLVVNLSVLLASHNSRPPTLEQCLLQCFQAAGIDEVGFKRIFDYEKGKILLLIDDAESWCELFSKELQQNPIFFKAHVVVTSRTAVSVRLAAAFHPKLTVELQGFGNELIQQFCLDRSPRSSLKLANVMSHIVTNTTGVNLTAMPGWLEHCHQVIEKGSMYGTRSEELLQRQIWLFSAFLEMNMAPKWLALFRKVQLQLGEAFLLYYLKKQNPQWRRFNEVDLLTVGPSPRLLIDYCMATYIISELDSKGHPPHDLHSNMEHAYMLQTSLEISCGQSMKISQAIKCLITNMADFDGSVLKAREHALDVDNTNSARILKRVNDLQVGCLRQSSTLQKYDAGVPDDLYYLGAEYARVYQLACEQGTKAVRRTRVMIVGHYGAGKTSVKRRLVNERFDQQHVVTNSIDVDLDFRMIHVDDASRRWNVIKKATVGCEGSNLALGVKDEHSSEVAGILYNFIKKVNSSALPVSSEGIEVHTPDVEFPPSLDFESSPLLPSEPSVQDELDGPISNENNNLDVCKVQRDQGSTNSSIGSGPSPMRSMSMTALVSAMGAAGLSDAEKVVDTFPEAIVCELKKLMNMDSDRRVTPGGHHGHAETCTSESNNEVSFTFWDFAGQHVFYTTHQTFLTHRAIYLVVLDLTRPLHSTVKSDRPSRDGMVADLACPQTVGEYLDFWLNSIHTHSVRSDSQRQQQQQQQQFLTPPPVIIICTHRDVLEQEHGKEEANRKVKEYFESINKYLDGKAFHDHVSRNFFALANSIDCDPSLDALRADLVRVAENQSYWGEPIPLKWLALRAKLDDLHNNARRVVTRSDIIMLAHKVGISCPTEVVTFLLFYHALGELIFFDEDSLRELVILDLQWLIENFREVITIRKFHKQKPFPDSFKHWANVDTYGVLNDIILQQVWDPSYKDQLVSIMQKFNLILPISNDYKPTDTFVVPGWVKSETQLYLVPCMLPQAQPQDIRLPGEGDPSPLLLTFTEGFVPLGVFHRLIAMCINQMHWECFGVVYNNFASFLPWPEKVEDVMISIYAQPEHIEITACSLGEDRVSTWCQELLPQALRTITEKLTVAMRIVCPTQSFFLAVRCTCKGKGQQGSIVNLDRIQPGLCTKKNIRCAAHKATFSSQPLQLWFGKQPEMSVIISPPSPAPNEDAEPSEKRLLTLAKELGIEWEELAIRLGLTIANIDQLKMDHPTAVTRSTHMLASWRHKQREVPLGRRIEHLINALRTSSRLDLAEKVATWSVMCE